MNLPGVLHLVDTLDPGGAERVAVNLVNHLSRERFRPFLATTRREGPLASEIRPDVGRLALNRTRTLDPGALRRLLAFVRENDVAILHAHASALFFAQLTAFVAPHLKVVWHDHFGRYLEEERPAWLWGPVVRRAAAVVAVNEDLARWSRETLGAGPAVYLPNFVPHVPETPQEDPTPDLPGEPGLRIVCVANLRAQKDHPNLLRAFARVLRDEPAARLLLAGADVEAGYAARVREEASPLGDRVVFLGSRPDVPALLRACDVGVLASASEGFPLSLLEYGRAGLPAVATRVGQCAEILDDGGDGEAGVLVPPADPDSLAWAILALLRDPARRTALGERLARRVRERYSPGAVLERLEAVYYRALTSERP